MIKLKITIGWPLVLLVILSTSKLFSQNISGEYSTNFKEMTLTQNGDKVTGTYKHKNGSINGVLNGNTLTGTWTQSDAKGRLKFVFSPDFSSFKGKWSYDNAEPTKVWNGEKTKDNSEQTILLGEFETDYDDMRLMRKGNTITGTYKHKDGVINGILNGNILTGTWKQNDGGGKLKFIFSSDFSSFKGKWNYDTKEPSRVWNGKRK
jgi:hypothetical protein